MQVLSILIHDTYQLCEVEGYIGFQMIQGRRNLLTIVSYKCILAQFVLYCIVLKLYLNTVKLVRIYKEITVHNYTYLHK